MKAERSVSLRIGFLSEGKVVFVGASIGGNLELYDGTFKNPGSNALMMMECTVEGAIAFVNPIQGTADSPAKISGGVNLRHAKVGQLYDSKEVWGLASEGGGHTSSDFEIALGGFTYGSLGWPSPTDVEFRKRWLKRGPEEGGFSPQPYTQLATVLKEGGHDREAKAILIERDRERLRRLRVARREKAKKEREAGTWKLTHAKARQAGVFWFEQAWGFVVDHTIRYGYQSSRAFLFLLAVWSVSSAVFAVTWKQDFFKPAVPFIYNSWVTDEDGNQRQRFGGRYDNLSSEQLVEYPKFNAFAYSIDTLLPIVDLHQENYWLPTGWVHVWLWAHIGGGWVFTTLAVVGFTGLASRDS